MRGVLELCKDLGQVPWANFFRLCGGIGNVEAPREKNGGRCSKLKVN